MKLLFSTSVLTLLFLLSSCTERTLSPPTANCTKGMPTFLMTVKNGSYWVYERTHIDTNGKELPFPKTYDTLTVISETTDLSDNGSKSIVLSHNFTTYSATGVPNYNLEQIYWRKSKGEWLVNNSLIQRACNFCPGAPAIIFRKYCDSSTKICENVNSPISEISGGDFTGTQTPFLKSGFSGLNVRIEAKNSYRAGTETVNPDFYPQYPCIITESDLFYNSKIFAPDEAVFDNEKKTVTFTDYRKIWCNSSVGMVRERAIIKSDFSGSYQVLPESYDRQLVDFSIK